MTKISRFNTFIVIKFDYLSQPLLNLKKMKKENDNSGCFIILALVLLCASLYWTRNFTIAWFFIIPGIYILFQQLQTTDPDSYSRSTQPIPTKEANLDTEDDIYNEYTDDDDLDDEYIDDDEPYGEYTDDDDLDDDYINHGYIKPYQPPNISLEDLKKLENKIDM
jgi:hypothetical protein